MNFDHTGINLLPCPFCGGAASIDESDHDGKFYYSVGCTKNTCRGFHSPMQVLDVAGEIVRWNSRSKEGRRKQILGIPCRCVEYSNPKTQAAYEEGFCDALQAAANYADVDRQLAEAGIDMEPAYKRLHTMVDAHRWKAQVYVGNKSDSEWWLRWTTEGGLYFWLHPTQNRWVGEPGQVTMPMFTNRIVAEAAISKAPVPPK